MHAPVALFVARVASCRLCAAREPSLRVLGRAPVAFAPPAPTRMRPAHLTALHAHPETTALHALRRHSRALLAHMRARSVYAALKNASHARRAASAPRVACNHSSARRAAARRSSDCQHARRARRAATKKTPARSAAAAAWLAASVRPVRLRLDPALAEHLQTRVDWLLRGAAC